MAMTGGGAMEGKGGVLAREGGGEEGYFWSITKSGGFDIKTKHECSRPNKKNKHR